MRGNMRAERARLGMSQAEVAAHLKVNTNSLARWEKGEVEPVADNLKKLARLYGCSVEYLLEQTNDRHGTAIGQVRD